MSDEARLKLARDKSNEVFRRIVSGDYAGREELYELAHLAISAYQSLKHRAVITIDDIRRLACLYGYRYVCASKSRRGLCDATYMKRLVRVCSVSMDDAQMISSTHKLCTSIESADDDDSAIDAKDSCFVDFLIGASNKLRKCVRVLWM